LQRKISWIIHATPKFLEKIQKIIPERFATFSKIFGWIRLGTAALYSLTPSLDACEAPLVQRKSLSCGEITEILHTPQDSEISVIELGEEALPENFLDSLRQLCDQPRSFNFNPAHCTKSVLDFKGLPENRNFDQFLNLFDRTDWLLPQKNNILMRKLCADDRFLDFLHEQFLAFDKKSIKSRSTDFVNDLAYKKMQDLLKNAHFLAFLHETFPNISEASDIPLTEVLAQYVSQLTEANNSDVKKSLIDFLCELLPDVSIQQISQNPIFYIQQLVDADREFLCRKHVLLHARAQLQICVDTLMKRRTGEGSIFDIEDAMDNSARILPFLLSDDLSPAEKEDSLVTLAVEGGHYCNRGIKRTTDDLIMGLCLPKDLDPQQRLELQVFSTLQFKRYTHIESAYNLIKSFLTKLSIPKEVADDTHAFDLYRLFLAVGFYPVSTNERLKFDFEALQTWENPFIKVYHLMMYLKYQTDLTEFVVQEVGALNLAILIRYLINNNTALSEEQKASLIEQLSNTDDMTPWYNLLFVMLGIFNYKKTIEPSLRTQEAPSAQEDSDDAEDLQIVLEHAKQRDAERRAQLQKKAAADTEYAALDPLDQVD
jgi:hypothetical protein